MTIRLPVIGLLIAWMLGGCGIGAPAASTVGCPASVTEGRLTVAGNGLTIDALAVRWWDGWTVRSEGGRLVVADQAGVTRAGAGDTVRLGGGHIRDVWFACPTISVIMPSAPVGSAG